MFSRRDAEIYNRLKVCPSFRALADSFKLRIVDHLNAELPHSCMRRPSSLNCFGK